MTQPMPSGVDLIVLAAIEALPDVMRAVRDIFKRKNPDEPDPTDEQVFAALEDAFAASLAKDDAWLAAHPEDEG